MVGTSIVAMPEPASDPDHLVAFRRECKETTLDAIRREAEAAGIDITDEQIERLILAPRSAPYTPPAFDLEYCKRHS